VIPVGEVNDRAEQTAQHSGRDVKEVPSPTFGRTVEFLRDLNQRAVRTDEQSARNNDSHSVEAMEQSRRNKADDRKRNDRIKFAEQHVCDKRMRRGRLVYFSSGRSPQKPPEQQRGHRNPCGAF